MPHMARVETKSILTNRIAQGIFSKLLHHCQVRHLMAQPRNLNDHQTQTLLAQNKNNAAAQIMSWPQLHNFCPPYGPPILLTMLLSKMALSMMMVICNHKNGKECGGMCL